MRTSLLVVTLCGITTIAFANGGPFVVKYPGGDPAAKGVLARLDPDLKPAREERLQVVKEDLSVSFGKGSSFDGENTNQSPLATVTAEYRIRNPTKESAEVDFGFPILRGIYVPPMSMMPRPDVRVTVAGKVVKTDIISNSAIYGLIRQRARKLIEARIADDVGLKSHVMVVRKASAATRPPWQEQLRKYAVANLRWNERDAALLAEYAAVDFGKAGGFPADAHWTWGENQEVQKLVTENLGILSAIGEQKATQLFAQLAGRFDPRSAASYEDIFQAWGGEITERSVDLASGKVRPREVVVPPNSLTGWAGRVRLEADPTLCARVDYLDDNAKLTADEKATCRTVLKNLPVVFTFAPMNLLHYRATFPPESEQTVTVTYRQFAYEDTKKPGSYQMAYVVHPASLWKEFGPIHLKITVPEGVKLAASAPCEKKRTESVPVERGTPLACDIYETELKSKTGELFVAIEQAGWQRFAGESSSVANRRAASTSPVAPLNAKAQSK